MRPHLPLLPSQPVHLPPLCSRLPWAPSPQPLCLFLNVFFYSVLPWAASSAVSPPPGRAPSTRPVPVMQAVLEHGKANKPKSRSLFPRTDLAEDRVGPLPRQLMFAGEGKDYEAGRQARRSGRVAFALSRLNVTSVVGWA